jgi:two-component system, cell cycle sensor histidine kinase and response regulator CckA
MHKSEQHFRTIAEAAPVMLCATGADRRCTFFNQKWLAFAGRTLDEQLASDWTENIDPDDLARCTTLYSESFDRRQEFNSEFRLRRADGEYRRAAVAGAPLHAPDGGFAGYVICCTDVTDMRRGQDEALVHRNLESVGVLASGIAHDFNNLLGSILAEAELALSLLSSHCSCAEEVQRIRNVAIRASEIVRELMVYAGQDKGCAEPINLSLLTEEMLSLLRISITKHAKLTTDLADDPPPVIAEAAELRQLLMNLILNASDALGEAEGEIHVATSSVWLNRAQAGNDLAPGNYLRLAISDTGRGMPRESQDRIFDPYFTTKRSGTGLGLGVVRRIVRRCGGAIQCLSAPGEGTQFIVLLPCASRAASDRAITQAPQPADPLVVYDSSVLLVEDEEGIRLAVANLLRRRGFRVTEAPDGSAAIELLRENKGAIDAILLDLTLPGMPSREVIAEAARIRPDVRIVLTSAYSRETAALELDALQVKAFIRKPYQLGELVRLLSDVMSPATGNDARRLNFLKARGLTSDPGSRVLSRQGPAA